MKELDSGRAVLISGGTGALGRAVVARFVAAGDRAIVPWIVKRERDAIEAEEADAIRRGAASSWSSATSPRRRARARAADALPNVEVLVNGVGGFVGGQPVHETRARASGTACTA